MRPTGTNQQRCRLEEALSDVLFSPVSTARPTHPGARQGDTDRTLDLALVSPRLAPWTRAETLRSHRRGKILVVFSLQKPGDEPRWKPQYTFKYGNSDKVVISKLQERKPAHNKSVTDSRHPATLEEQGNPDSVD